MMAVQAEGSAALVNAFESGAKEPEPVSGASSVADSIVVEAPRCGILALREIRESGGRAIAVSDAEILSSLALLGRLTGIFVEPSSAAAVGGLAKERQAGRVADDECAVLLLTGTGLKDIAAARRAVEMPPSIDPNFQAFEEALGRC
jgi:threonine synthase